MADYSHSTHSAWVTMATTCKSPPPPGSDTISLSGALPREADSRMASLSSSHQEVGEEATAQQTRETEVCQQPRWNQKLVFKVGEKHHYLNVCVYDRLGEDRGDLLIGHVRLPSSPPPSPSTASFPPFVAPSLSCRPSLSPHSLVRHSTLSLVRSPFLSWTLLWSVCPHVMVVTTRGMCCWPQSQARLQQGQW